REDRRLVGNLHHRVLGKDDLEAAIREWKRTRSDLPELNPVIERPLRHTGTGLRDQIGLQVDSDHTPRAVLLDEQAIDGTEPRADIEHPAPADIEPLERPGHLFRAAGRQETIAPHELQQSLQALVVLPDLTRLIDLDAHRPRVRLSLV